MRHEILWKYRDDATAPQQLEFERLLLKLASNNSSSSDSNHADLGITRAFVATYNSKEGLNQGYTHVLTFEFRSSQDRDRYLVHDRHKNFLAYLGTHPIVEKFVAFDYVEPVTPRRVLAAAEAALAIAPGGAVTSEEKQTTLPTIYAALQGLLDTMSKNASAFQVFAFGREVGSRDATYAATQRMFARVQAVLKPLPASDADDSTPSATAS